MSDKGILGGKIANVIDIHQEALHLTLQPVVMLILYLMQGNEKFSVIENTRSLPRPLRNSALCVGLKRGTSIACQWINTSDSIGHIMTWNRLSEAFMVCIVKT